MGAVGRGCAALPGSVVVVTEATVDDDGRRSTRRDRTANTDTTASSTRMLTEAATARRPGRGMVADDSAVSGILQCGQTGPGGTSTSQRQHRGISPPSRDAAFVDHRG